MNSNLKVKCPICEKSLLWSPENTFKPFCSERCKLIDLGEWASGGRNIPGETITEESEEFQAPNLDPE